MILKPGEGRSQRGSTPIAAFEQELAQYGKRHRGKFIKFAHNDVMRIKLFYGVVEKSNTNQLYP